MAAGGEYTPTDQPQRSLGAAWARALACDRELACGRRRGRAAGTSRRNHLSTDGIGAGAEASSRAGRILLATLARMPRTFDFPDGSPVGNDADAPAPAVRKTSNAFGSPGSDSTVKRIDLNDALVANPASTYIMRSSDDTMARAGIAAGDALLVDLARKPVDGSIVVAMFEGQPLCRRLSIAGGRRGAQPHVMSMVAADGVTPEIILRAEADFRMLGVVTTIIKSLEA